MSSSPIFITRDGVRKIERSSAIGGDLRLALSKIDDFYVVTGVEIATAVTLDVSPAKPLSALKWVEGKYCGQWLAGVDELAHVMHLSLAGRPGTALSVDDFRQMVPQVRNANASVFPLITRVPNLSREWSDGGVKEYVGWIVGRDDVRPADLIIEPERTGVWQLDPRWPVAALQTRRVAVVGLGSIGGRVAESLAAYGLGHLDLIDPGRFLWHNQVRHVLGPESVGRGKAAALKAFLDLRWPETQTHAWAWDIVNEAHLLRRLLADVDLVVCAADGIGPRRVVSHLARRVKVTAVQACVLADGAIGEVIRFRPSRRFGCLLCQRADLLDRGALDAESHQELDYGTGLTHKPMTAVGPDLQLVAQVAAKVSVATILESQHGDVHHRLPGECAVIGLRPTDEFEAPFDVDRAAAISWSSIPRPRRDCVTCGG